MLLLSDLHLQEDSQDIVLGEVIPGIIEVARESGEEHIAILGDVFHFRYHVPVKLLNGLRDALTAGAEHGLRFTILPGNHDQVDVEGRNALECVGDLPHVTVHTYPYWGEDGLWFPYRKQELVEPLLAEMIRQTPLNNGDAPVLFIHHGIKGAWMNDGFQNTDGLPIGLFATFGMVLCGHWHKFQYVGRNCAYVGSPYQTKADESGQAKGYCTWDGGQLTHHPMDWGHRYHRLTSADGTLDLQHVKPGDDVRVNARTKEEAEALGKILNQLGVSHVINIDQEKLEARLDVQDGAPLEAYVRAYVAVAETELNKERLLQVYQQVTA